MDANRYTYHYRYADTGDGYTHTVTDRHGNEYSVSYAAPISNTNAGADNPHCARNGQNVLRRRQR